MELPAALSGLKLAALRHAAKRRGFAATDRDIEVALRLHPNLQEAFDELHASESAAARFGEAVRLAFKKMNDWYSDSRSPSDK